MADKFGDTRGQNDTWLRWVEYGKYSQVVELKTPNQLSAFGEQLVSQIMPQAAWRFDYGVNTRFISTTGTMNGGYVSGIFSQANLYTSTNVSGTAQITSIRPVRYLPGFGGLNRFTALFNVGIVNTEQLVGISDVTVSDGFGFGYNGTSFGVVSIRSGVKTWIPQSGWNGNVLSYDLNPQTGNVYQIRFQWLGYGNIYFMVFDKIQRQFVVIHAIEYPNTSIIPSILNPTLKLIAKISNLGNNTNIHLSTPSSLGALEGHTDSDFYNPLNVSNSFDTILAVSDTNNNHLATIRNSQSFLGANNRIPAQITSITVSRAGGAGTSTNTIFRIYRNASTAGALSFVNVDTLNSPMSDSNTATTITSSNAERSYSLSQNTTQSTIQFKSGEFIINPGESISVGVQDSGGQATDVAITINWEELF